MEIYCQWCKDKKVSRNLYSGKLEDCPICLSELIEVKKNRKTASQLFKEGLRGTPEWWHAISYEMLYFSITEGLRALARANVIRKKGIWNHA